MFHRNTKSSLTLYVSSLLAHVPHGFSTRGGGVSAGAFESLNLGVLGAGVAAG